MSIVSQNIGTYCQVKTASIVDVALETLENEGLQYLVTPERKNITKILLPDIQVNDGTSLLQGQIYLRNSEVPGVALTVFVGAYRFICSNGVVIGEGEGGKVIHRAGKKIEQFLAEIPDLISRSVIHLKEQLNDTIVQATDIKITNPIEIVGNLPIQHSVKEKVINDICWGSATENTSNVWGLYNYINEVTRTKTRYWDTAIEKDIGLLQHIELLAA